MITHQIEVPYCEDCKWHRAGSSPKYGRCMHPAEQLDGEAVVSRRYTEGARFCSSARTNTLGKCGFEGKHFQAREIVSVPIPRRWWQRIFS